jgi:hypothetical protein
MDRYYCDVCCRSKHDRHAPIKSGKDALTDAFSAQNGTSQQSLEVSDRSQRQLYRNRAFVPHSSSFRYPLFRVMERFKGNVIAVDG